MVKIGDDYWNHKGFDIYGNVDHPKLYGRYEIYKGCYFIGRSKTLKEAKEIIKTLRL